MSLGLFSVSAGRITGVNMTETVFQLDQYFSHVPMIDNINSNDLQNIRNWIQTKPQLPYITGVIYIYIYIFSIYAVITCII